MALRRAWRSISSPSQWIRYSSFSTSHPVPATPLPSPASSPVAPSPSKPSPSPSKPSPSPTQPLGHVKHLNGRGLVGLLRWQDGAFEIQSSSWQASVRPLSLAAAESMAPSGPVKAAGGFQLNEVAVERAAHIGYTVVGRLDSTTPQTVEPQEAFAVVQIGSHQFKVTPGDCIYTEKLKFADINDKIRLNKVLLLGSKDQSIIGRPVVPSSAVFAIVEEQALDAKVIVFKKKRRKNYRRTRGHRQELTRLRITNIEGLELNTFLQPKAVEAN